MNKIALYLLFICSVLTASGQQRSADSLIIMADLGNLPELPRAVNIVSRDIGGYTLKSDTVRVKDKTLSYATSLKEPRFLNVIFSWRSHKNTRISFWAVPSTYQLVLDSNLEPLVKSGTIQAFAREIEALEKQVVIYGQRGDSLVKLVNYVGTTNAEYKNRINVIRDSIDNSINENLYRRYVLANLNSPAGLYALCKYTAGLLSGPQRNIQADTIEKFLNQMDRSVRLMPSAGILYDKLNLAKKMAMGKALDDISLPDTTGKTIAISSFRGKYLLIEFWASWCGYCREESPGLIKAYNQYRSSGFRVVGITLDELSIKKYWMKAISEDHVGLWPQLSDFDKLAQKAYDVRLIPANILLDPNGVIIARNVWGNKLEEILRKVFKN